QWIKAHAPVLCCLLMLYAVGAGYRLFLFQQLSNYHPQSDIGFFWTENALQYHYAHEVAEGQFPPRVDPLFEHPEGLETHKQLTMMMEYVHGGLYLMFGGSQAFHSFLIVCICFTSMLVLFPVYGIAREVTGQAWPGVYAAALYTVAMPGFARILGSYGREHFALPLIFGGLWALLRSMTAGRRSHWFALTAGVFFSLALASWHFARFAIGLMLVLYLFVLFMRRASPAPAPPAETGARLRFSLLALLLPILFTALVHPALRHRLLHAGGDTHVWSLFAAKLIHLGQKPALPSELSFETRFLWVEAFNAPDLNTWLYGYGMIPLLALVGVVRLLRKRPVSPSVLLTLALALVFFILFLLVQRMHGFLIVFLCVLAAPLLADLDVRSRIGTVSFFMAFGGLIFEGHKFYHYGKPVPYKQWVDRTFPPPAVEEIPDWQFNTITLVDWLQAVTQTTDGILARYSLSPVIAAYAHRPVVLHSKAENPVLRQRIQDYYNALFSSEEAFATFCRANEVSYVVVDAATVLMRGPDSERYLVDQLQLSVDSCAYRLQFQPDALHQFAPVFQNPRYRVYAFLEAVTPPAYVPSYQRLFDARAFGAQAGETFVEEGRGQVYRDLRRAVGLQQEAQVLMRHKQLARALPLFTQALKLNAGLPGLASDAAQAHFLAGHRPYAHLLVDGELKQHPSLIRPYDIKARMLIDEGKTAEARAVLEAGLNVRPESFLLKQLLEKMIRQTGLSVPPPDSVGLSRGMDTPVRLLELSNFLRSGNPPKNDLFRSGFGR
ncbi:MAG: hypothetical protein ACI97B_004218, partial [Verrucomicrobiales bacterium]